MRGIILAGGMATRLRPSSLAVSKQLMTVYDKPLIYYPISTLMLCGIKEILLISTPNDLPIYKRLFWNSSQLGINIEYRAQQHPGGICEAFIIGEDFIKDESVCLILGDNFFHGMGLGQQLRETYEGEGALVAAYQVSNPENFGVIELNEKGQILSIEEKPTHPKSNLAVTGIYFYDESVMHRVKNLTRSSRGELEITDLNNSYLADNKLKVIKLSRGTTWLDMGTPDTLLDAAHYVKLLQQRQGQLIGSPEEVSWRLGLINSAKLIELARPLASSTYGQTLIKLAKLETEIENFEK